MIMIMIIANIENSNNIIHLIELLANTKQNVEKKKIIYRNVHSTT